MNFLYQNNLPEDLKSKRSVASFAAKPWFTISRFLITGLCECLHSKQLELSKSFLENIENCTYRFALLASVKSSSSSLRAKSQLFWIQYQQLSFSTSQFQLLSTEKLFLIKNRNFHSAPENKTTWLKNNNNNNNNNKKQKHSDYYYLSSREMINILSSKLAGLLRNF